MIYDKRKLKRYDIFLIVEFKPLRSPGGFSIGITRDLSPDGFSLESQTIECQRGEILEFRLKHPDASWTVDISGEVIWRNHSWYKYVVGIKFLKLNEEQHTKILKLMSAVKGPADKPDLNSENSESVRGTEEEKYPDAILSAGVIDTPQATKTGAVSLRGLQHCELTGTERTFIAGDAWGISIADSAGEIKPAGDKDNSDKILADTPVKHKELNPDAAQKPADDKAADRREGSDIKEEPGTDREKIYAAHLNTTSQRDKAQASFINDIDPAGTARKKKLWLYVPFVMVILIILAIALPVMINKFNHETVDSMPVMTESSEHIDAGINKDISSADNEQMSSKALIEPAAPSPVQETGPKETMPPEKDKENIVRQASPVKEPTPILPPKSIVTTELKNKKAEDTAPPAAMGKIIKNTPQMNNADIFKPETSAAAKPLRDNVEKSNKIDLIAKIDDTFKDLQAIQNEKPQEAETIIETSKMPEDKPLIKTEEQPAIPQPVKSQEIPAAAAIIKRESVPEVKQELKVPEENKNDIKKAEQSVRRPEMPNVVLLVKRDKSKNTQNNSSNISGLSTSDLLKKWKHIGSTKSGVPLFIAPDNISYPYEHVVNLLVKASINKKDFIDLLAINCSQIKLRILEERNGNNPVFSSYSNEWKDIIPDSMILYNSACPEKR